MDGTIKTPHDYRMPERTNMVRSCLYPVVPIGSNQFNRFIEYLASIADHKRF